MATTKKTKRRGRGEGGLFWDASRARWVGVVDLGTDPTTGKRIRRKVSDKDRSKAREKLDALRREKDDTGNVSSATYTVADAANDWLSMGLKSKLARNTVTQYRWAATTITRHLGRRRLRALTSAHVHGFLSTLARDHGTRTVRVAHQALRRIIKFAQAHDRVARNVADFINIPDGQDRRDPRSMTWEQTQALWASVAGTRIEPFVALCLWGCLRRREALALRWSDVDLNTGTISVARSLTVDNGEAFFTTPKTKGSVRTIGLPDSVEINGRVVLSPNALTALRAWKVRQATERLEFPGTYEDNDLIVCRVDGKPLAPTVALRHFKRATVKAGLGHEWRVHELRHTGASLYLEAGVQLHVISAYLGHADVAITARTYLHWTAEHVSLSGGETKLAGSQ